MHNNVSLTPNTTTSIIINPPLQISRPATWQAISETNCLLQGGYKYEQKIYRQQASLKRSRIIFLSTSLSGALANRDESLTRRARVQTSVVNDKLGYYYTGQIVLNWLLLSCKQSYEWRGAACKVRNCSANKILLIYGQFSTSVSTHPLTNPFWLRCDSSHIPVQRTTISLWVVNYS